MDPSSDTKDNFARFASNRLSAYMVQQDVQHLFIDPKEELDIAVDYSSETKTIFKPEKQEPDTVADYCSEEDTVVSIHSIEIAPRFNCFKSVSCDIGRMVKREIDSMQNNLQKVKDKHARLKSTTNKKVVKVLKKILP